MAMSNFVPDQNNGTLFATHFCNYSHKSSYENFMKNNFAPFVKTSINDLIYKNGWKNKFKL
jgi:hypothetical protein